MYKLNLRVSTNSFTAYNYLVILYSPFELHFSLVAYYYKLIDLKKVCLTFPYFLPF